MEAYHPSTLRRVRANSHIRQLVADTRLWHKNFIQPIFVEEGIPSPTIVPSLPDVWVHNTKSIHQEVNNCIANGITKFLLFPIPNKKQEIITDFSFASKLVAAIKQHFGNRIWLAVDVCLCSYTTHGHCGILNAENDKILNNESIKIITNYALNLAKAGADCIAPSDMLDGRIAAIRNTLNQEQLDEVSILSYSSKFSSQLYGPFRDACNSAPKNSALQNRKTYQISPINAANAIESSLRDAAEGADMLMVKPAALYTDIIAQVRASTHVPIVAYHVSGEYAAVELLAQNNLADRAALHIEVWIALQRSGANAIISYAAKYAKEWIEKMDI